MFERIRERISSAHLIAFAALAVALSGTAYAATKIDTDDIKNKAVTKQKLDKAAVSTNRIVDGAVRAAKLGGIREVEDTTTVTQNTNGGVTVDCNTDERVIGGGYESTPSVPNTQIFLAVEDKRDGNGWRVFGQAIGANQNLTVYAYCLET